jgi:hypothetical protein
MVPATIISIDRMTVDVGVGALAAAFVYYAAAGRDRSLWVTLAAACLVRETGMLLVGACVLPALFRREWRRSIVWASAAVPALCWFAYLQWTASAIKLAHEPMVPTWVVPRFQVGSLRRLMSPLHYDLAPPLERIAQVLDALAILATLAAGVIALMRLRRTPQGPIRESLGLHGAFVFLMTSSGFWVTPFAYGRPLAPLFVQLFLGRGLGLASLVSAIVDLRLLTEIRSQVVGVLHWL